MTRQTEWLGNKSEINIGSNKTRDKNEKGKHITGGKSPVTVESGELIPSSPLTVRTHTVGIPVGRRTERGTMRVLCG